MKTGLPKNNLLIALILACFALSAYSCNNGKNKTAEQVVAKEVWTCSMHPEVIRDGPGTCPICGMVLIKKEEKAVAVSGVALDDLLQPTNQWVVSSIPVTTVRKETK